MPIACRLPDTQACSRSLIAIPVLLVLAFLPACSEKAQGPLYFVSAEGEGTSTEHGTEVTVFLKQLNLPDNYKEVPPIRTGETWWLGAAEGIWQVTCGNVETAAGRTGPRTGGLLVLLKSATPVKGRGWLLSKSPLPRQTWQQREEVTKDGTLRVIITTGKGQFRLDSVNLPPKEGMDEADGPSEVRVDIHQRKKADDKWKKRDSFMTSAEARPYLDVDGDGVPEIINFEWYNDPVLRRFYPGIKVLAIDRSGV